MQKDKTIVNLEDNTKEMEDGNIWDVCFLMVTHKGGVDRGMKMGHVALKAGCKDSSDSTIWIQYVCLA